MYVGELTPVAQPTGLSRTVRHSIPLACLIKKLKSQLQKNNTKRAAYELNPYDPILDIPIYDDCLDGAQTLGYPCLSHLSFKVTSDRRLMLVAFYRSHHYIQRALGNLYGLGWLQHYVATQAGIEPATLLCISSMAMLDTSSKQWGSSDIENLLDECNGILNKASVDQAA